MEAIGDLPNQNKSYKKLTFEILLGFFSFIIPLALLLIIFAINGIHPFGNNTIAIIDMKSQYVTYMSYYREILKGNNSSIYTMSKVFGGNFQSIFTYYLASPFNFLILLYKDNAIPDFFLLITLLKICFSGLNMYLLLRFSRNKAKLHYLLFAVAYALSSYSIIYISNYMWLDGVMILPLVILGMIKLEEGKHYWIYLLALGYALFSNWYIGAIICIFVVLFFLYRFFSKQEPFKERLPYLFRFIVFSLIAGLLSGVSWITAFYHFGGTKASFNFSNFYVISPMSVFVGFFENNLYNQGSISINSGYMTMFTSIVSLIFFQLFFLNPKYSVKERISAGILFLIYIVFSFFSPTYILMHGGREPTWFPSRYSFIIGFIVLYFGEKSFDELDASPIWSISIPLTSGIIFTIILNLMDYKINNNFYGKYDFSIVSALIYFISLLLIFAYLLINYLKLPINKKYVSIGLTSLLIIFTGVSSFRGANTSLNKLVGSSLKYEDFQYDNFLRSDFNKIKEYDSKDIYRMEATFLRKGTENAINNNPLFYSYSGLSHYSSTELKDIQNFTSMLGFHNNGYFEKYDSGSTAAMNALLNVRYLVGGNDGSTVKPLFINNYPYKQIEGLESDNEEIKFYQNQLTLPLGFISDYQGRERVIDYSTNEEGVTHWFDHFEYQNSMYKMICNSIKDSEDKQKDIFTKISPESITFTGDVLMVTKEDGLNYYTGKKGAVIKITYKTKDLPDRYNLYFAEKNYNQDVSYLMNNVSIQNSYWNNGIKPIEVSSDGTYILKMTLKTDLNDTYIRDEFYYEDIDILEEYVNEINLQKATKFKVVKGFSSFGYETTFTINKPNQEVIFTLPNEKGINIYIDNKKVGSFTRFNIFTGADLSNLSLGDHTIKIVYRDSGLTFGLVSTLFGIASGIVCCLSYTKIEGKIFKKKKENER